MTSKLQQLLDQVNIDASARLKEGKRADVTPLDKSMHKLVSGGLEPTCVPNAGDAYIKYWQDL